MKIQDLINLYENKKAKIGDDANLHISEILQEAKELHHKDWLQSPTSKGDYEQSWRAFKGKNLEKLLMHIIKKFVKSIKLEIISGNTLERTNNLKLTEELDRIKRNLLVDYGEFGFHLPDVDLIIYNPNTYKIIVVISSKVTLRERIAQTGYWKIKFSQSKVTNHIKVFFITPDEDNTLKVKIPARKGRAIVEIDTDGCYIMNEEEIVESEKVKKFEKFFIDLKELNDAKRNKK